MKKYFYVMYLCFVTLSFVALPTAYAVASEPLVTAKNLELTRDDYEAALSVVPKAKREQMEVSVKQVMIFLESVLVYSQLADEARDLGLDKNPIIQREVQQAVNRVLGTHRLEALEKSLKLPDFSAAAKERYVTRKEEFTVPEAVHVQHVLVLTQGRSDEEARKRAEEIRQKAVKGEDFAVLAKEYSEDQSKERNSGDLGFFERKKMVPAFEQAAFALSKAGEISPLVKTQFGYHIIRFVEKRAERLKPFDDVKESIVNDLREKFIADARNAHISDIKNDKSIVIHEAAIEAMSKK